MKTLFHAQDAGLLPLFAPVYGGSGQVLLSPKQRKHHIMQRNDSESFYFRDGLNPTVNHVEGHFRQAYQVNNARLVQSGMAAINVAIFSALKPGSRIFVSSDTFVDTQLLALDHYCRWGISTQIFDLTSDGRLPAEINLRENDVVVIESVSNPLCRVTDIASLQKVASEQKAVLIIDNTIPSSEKFHIVPNSNCIVVESLTKYHLMNTAWAGLIMTSAAFKTQVHEVIKLFGFALPAETAASLEKSMLTLKLRLDLQNQNKKQVLQWLLKTQNDQEASFEVANLDNSVDHPFIVLKFTSDAKAKATLDAFTEILPSPSFGGPQTMVSLGNFHTTSGTAAMLGRRGVNGKILRICCGFENAESLVKDLSNALGVKQ